MSKHEQATRFELIDQTGRVIVHYAPTCPVIVEEQDDGRTVKVFVDSVLRDNELQRLRERLAKVEATAKERGKTIDRLEKQIGWELNAQVRREAYEQGKIAGYQNAKAEKEDT